MIDYWLFNMITQDILDPLLPLIGGLLIGFLWYIKDKYKGKK